MEQLLRATADAEGRHFWFRGFRAFVAPLLRAAIDGRVGDGPVRILDCGCGTGANLVLLNRFGRAYGFDLSPVGLRIGRQSGRTLLARATVTAVPFPTASFDVVTSFDVLYSLDDDALRRALSEMYRLLKPGGCAVVNVAAMKMLQGDHSVLSNEVRRFERDELSGCMTAAGFEVRRITYTNFTLFPLVAIVRAFQRRRGLRAGDGVHHELQVPPEPVNGLLTGLLLLESVWLRRFNAPVGSSLLCLAQKPTSARS